MNLFNVGEFKLASGLSSDFKVDCDALSDADLEAVAGLLIKILPSKFSAVLGVPEGGLRLAKALRVYVDPTPGNPLLVVDDVYTTGRSMWEFTKDFEPGSFFGAVIFARKNPEWWITPLWTLNKGLWL